MAKNCHKKSGKDSESSAEIQKEKNRFLREKIMSLEKTIEELGTSHQHLEQIVVNSGFILFIVNQKGEIFHYSTSVDRVLGYNQEEVVGTEIYSYIHPDDSRNVSENGRRLFNFESLWQRENAVGMCYTEFTTTNT